MDVGDSAAAVGAASGRSMLVPVSSSHSAVGEKQYRSGSIYRAFQRQKAPKEYQTHRSPDSGCTGKGTVFILEQCAILKDAAADYSRSL